MITQYRSDALRRVLQGMHESITGVHASVIANTDGLLVMSYPPDRDDARAPAGSESVAAMSAVLLSLSETTLDRLAQGQVERVMIEGEDGVVVIVPAAEDAALAVLVDKDARLGITLRAIRLCAEKLRPVFDR